MSNKHNNSRKNSFIKKFPDILLEEKAKELREDILFSFKFFDNDQASKGVGQDLCQWSQENLVKLLNKLKEYSKFSIAHWRQMPIGSGQKRMHVLEVYDTFPSKSDFSHPKHIPLDVQWARFRLEGDMRLIGFVIDEKQAEELNLNPNVFYAVFLDEHHQFYKTK